MQRLNNSLHRILIGTREVCQHGHIDTGLCTDDSAASSGSSSNSGSASRRPSSISDRHEYLFQKLGSTVAVVKGIDDDGCWYTTVSSLGHGGLPRLGQQVIANQQPLGFVYEL
jgi:hypothetical protein